MTAQKTELQPPMSDTVHLSNLKLAERSMTPGPTASGSEGKIEGLQTDVVMLQKADVWMSQFKTRLNVGIIALVVIWGSVSYYKSTEIRLEARTPPEQIVADGSHVEDPVLIQDIEGDAMQRETPIEAEKVKTEEAVSNLPVKAAKAAPTKTVKKAVAQKNVKSKMAGSKNSGRQQKKLKKSLAAKPAS